MSGSGRVTLNDVAAASGVSRATVSFVLNDDPRPRLAARTALGPDAAGLVPVPARIIARGSV